MGRWGLRVVLSPPSPLSRYSVRRLPSVGSFGDFVFSSLILEWT